MATTTLETLFENAQLSETRTYKLHYVDQLASEAFGEPFYHTNPAARRGYFFCLSSLKKIILSHTKNDTIYYPELVKGYLSISTNSPLFIILDIFFQKNKTAGKRLVVMPLFGFIHCGV